MPLLRITLMELEVLYQAAESHAVVMAAKQKSIDDSSTGSRTVRGTINATAAEESNGSRSKSYVVTTVLVAWYDGMAVHFYWPTVMAHRRGACSRHPNTAQAVR